jgi:hypothetical protein
MPTASTDKLIAVPGLDGIEAQRHHEHTVNDDGYWFNVKLTVPGAGEITAAWSGPADATVVSVNITLSEGWEFQWAAHKPAVGREAEVVLQALMNMTSNVPFTIKQVWDGAVLNAAWRESMIAEWRVPGPVPRMWWSAKWHRTGPNFPRDDGSIVWMPIVSGGFGVWTDLRLNVYPDCVLLLFGDKCFRSPRVFDALTSLPSPFDMTAYLDNMNIVEG